jgi:hypothetical protein
VLTGIVTSQNSPRELRNFFSERLQKDNPKTSTFIGICNLKLNNGLLVGNGYFFYEPVLNKISEIIKEELDLGNAERKSNSDDFLIMQSFSWFEISLIIFCEDPNKISTILTELRKLRSHELPEFTNRIEKTVYFKSPKYNSNAHPEDQTNYINDSHVFADTHSYFGVDYEAFQRKDFMKRFDNERLLLQSETEWQVKPGHLYDLILLLKKHFKEIAKEESKEFKSKTDKYLYYDLQNTFLITGKTDYFISNKESTDFGNTHKLFQIFFRRSSGNKIYDYVKKVKTNIQLSHKVDHRPGKRHSNRINTPQSIFRKDLKALAKRPNEINELNTNLKALKISRQIRSKITKIFYNYNNGILDSILFVYFIDFTQFIDALEDYIKEVYSKWRTSIKAETLEAENLGVKDIEESLKIRIKCFEEAYDLRMMNCYQYEDISDIDLDFNSSIQQLLTTYSIVAATVNRVFYNRRTHIVPLVLLNENKTEANYFSINYNIYHLLSPELVFFTIAKEVLNEYKSDMDQRQLRKLIVIKEDLLKQMSKNDLLKNYIKAEEIDFDYLLIDSIRLYYITNLDFKLFSYWFWMYNLQNASLYEKTGIIKEEHFRKELFRLMFIGRLYKFSTKPSDCPVPELQNYWDKYFFKFHVILESLFGINPKTNDLENVDFKKTIANFKQEAVRLISILNEKQTSYISPSNSLTISQSWKQEFSSVIHDERTLDHKIDTLGRKNIQFPDANVIDYSLSAFGNRYKAINYFFEGCKKKFEDGIPVLYKDDIFLNPALFINALMYSYLKHLFILNGQKVKLLRRNWMTGQPLKCFIEVENKETYSVDQTGGTFFYCPYRLNAYFKTRNSILQSLWHFSEIQKKTLLESIISNKANLNGKKYL